VLENEGCHLQIALSTLAENRAVFCVPDFYVSAWCLMIEAGALLRSLRAVDIGSGEIKAMKRLSLYSRTTGMYSAQQRVRKTPRQTDRAIDVDIQGDGC
jgi:hypothetical protein